MTGASPHGDGGAVPGLSRSGQERPLAASLAAAAAFVLFLCLVLQPFWETNDDAGMSMAAHGYGAAAFGSPRIIFSNVLWGLLVRSIPLAAVAPGYSLAALAALTAAGAALLWALHRLETPLFQRLLLFALLMARPVLFPQFTVTSGLLALSAVLCIAVHARRGGKGSLASGCVLFFFSFLIRPNEAFLVLAAASPLLPWRDLLGRRPFRIAVLSLAVAIALSILANSRAYSGPEWLEWKAFNAVRVPITDFGAGERLMERPDILARHGYTVNDMALLRDWFFADPDLANPGRLRAMLRELGPLVTARGSLSRGWEGIAALWSRRLLPLLLAAVLLGILRPGRRAFLCWGLCAAAIFSMGVLGRPGVVRVYVPLASLLAAAPIAAAHPGPFRRRACTAVLLAACAWNAFLAVPESLEASAYAGRGREALAGFPEKAGAPAVSWGGAFPYHRLYPVLWPVSKMLPRRIAAMGWMTLAPYSVHAAMEARGKGLVSRLRSEEGLPLVARERQVEELRKYFAEHFGGQLVSFPSKKFGIRGVKRFGPVTVRMFRCLSPDGR